MARLSVSTLFFIVLLQKTKQIVPWCGRYFAPEVHKRGQKYGKPCDMWSVGVVVYVMLSGIPPFYDHDEDTQDLGAANGLSMTEAICTASYDFPSPEWDGISDTARCAIQVVDVLPIFFLT
eukprot:SAG31_NODE_82_length_27046_cov_45.857275_9_plen_121_part_00